MIVVYGRLDDPPIGSVVEALQAAHSPYVLVEQSVLDRADIGIEIGSHGVDGCLAAAGEVFAFDDIGAVYARPLDLPRSWSGPDAAGRAHVFHEQFLGWLDVATALVISRPRAMHANASKPLQAQLIAESGLAVPQTLVTNDPAEARAFWREHGRVIFKSTSGVRSIVAELDEQSASALERVTYLPTQFQAYIDGVDVRVHVVGRRTFAVEIASAATDYRYAAQAGADVRMLAVDLPADVAQRCADLAERMELPLAGIDLRRLSDGRFVCFEVNPMPAYSYYEGQTGQPISRALAALLIEHDAMAMESIDGSGSRKSLADQRHDHGAQAASVA